MVKGGFVPLGTASFSNSCTDAGFGFGFVPFGTNSKSRFIVLRPTPSALAAARCASEGSHSLLLEHPRPQLQRPLRLFPDVFDVRVPADPPRTLNAGPPRPLVFNRMIQACRISGAPHIPPRVVRVWVDESMRSRIRSGFVHVGGAFIERAFKAILGQGS